MDGFDRAWYSVSQDAAFVGIAKAPAKKINEWTKRRGWSQITLVSGYDFPFQADYKCQGESDDTQWPVMHVFRKHDGKIFHFWATERQANHVDTVWPYWNLSGLHPGGSPRHSHPATKFPVQILGRTLSEQRVVRRQGIKDRRRLLFKLETQGLESSTRPLTNGWVSWLSDEFWKNARWNANASLLCMIAW